MISHSHALQWASIFILLSNLLFSEMVSHSSRYFCLLIACEMELQSVAQQKIAWDTMKTSKHFILYQNYTIEKNLSWLYIKKYIKNHIPSRCLVYKY